MQAAWGSNWFLSLLALNENLFYGTLPTEVSNMPQLQIFSARRERKSGPKLSGKLPKFDENPSLTVLFLDGWVLIFCDRWATIKSLRNVLAHIILLLHFAETLSLGPFQVAFWSLPRQYILSILRTTPSLVVYLHLWGTSPSLIFGWKAITFLPWIPVSVTKLIGWVAMWVG